jgi:hypothetical protein
VLSGRSDAPRVVAECRRCCESAGSCQQLLPRRPSKCRRRHKLTTTLYIPTSVPTRVPPGTSIQVAVGGLKQHPGTTYRPGWRWQRLERLVGVVLRSPTRSSHSQSCRLKPEPVFALGVSRSHERVFRIASSRCPLSGALLSAALLHRRASPTDVYEHVTGTAQERKTQVGPGLSADAACNHLPQSRSCEPCRISKIRCDHATPTCQKCHTRGITDQVRLISHRQT